MMIDISGMEFAYRKDPVLKNVSLSIDKGEFVAVVGPNGSGKSTLIRLMDGILFPRKGKISVGGADIRTINRNKLARKIAYVPQSEDRMYRAKVFDIVLMGRKPYINWMPGKNDHAIVINVLRTLKLDDIAMGYLDELSGGQRQRVFIARALAQEPDILLMDEPTANLDILHTMQVLDILRSLTEKGISVIIAIHDLNLAVRYCNRIVMLNNGEIFANGGKEIMTAENIEKLYNVKVQIFRENGDIFFMPKRMIRY